MAGSTFSVGEVSYNGYTFPAALTAKVRAVPIYDTADRARKYVQYTITVEAIVTGGEAPHSTPSGQTDVNLDDIRSKLSAPNKELTFSDQGFGTFVVGPDAAKIDSRFGPKPRLLAWEPVGSNRACRVAWTCEVTIPECSDGTPFYTGAFAEITYETTWSIGEGGMTVRTIKATIERPVNTNGNQILDTADLYRDILNPPVPLGFWRDRHYHESRDKRILEITIVDTEVPSENPFFPYAIRCDVRHRISSDLEDRGLVWWASTIQGTIEYAAGASRAQLLQAFLAIVNSRRLLAVGVQIPLNGTKQGNSEAFPIVTKISLEESLFSRELSFAVSWHIFADISQIMGASGLFRPVGTDWNTWKTSLTQVNGVRGIANMGSKTTDDVIVDLCTTDYPQPNSDINKNAADYSSSLFSYGCDQITPAKSWRKYDVRVHLKYDTNTAQHQSLAEMPTSHITTSNAYPDASKTGLDMSQTSDSMIVSSQDSNIIQLRGPTKVTLVFKGNAERVCNDIPVPKVVSIGGKTASQIKSWYEPYVKTTASRLTIYGLVWYQEYYLDSPPEGDLYSSLETDGIPEYYTGNNRK